MCIHRNLYHRKHKHTRPPFCTGKDIAKSSHTAEERLREQLTDPFYQLLVCHTIFCRQIEERFICQPRNTAPKHRPMRRP